MSKLTYNRLLLGGIAAANLLPPDPDWFNWLLGLVYLLLFVLHEIHAFFRD